jgi:hypothetical protein
VPKTQTTRPDPVRAASYDLKAILDNVDFSVEDVAEAAAKQPRLFLAAVDFRIAKMQELSAAEMVMEETSAERELAIRKEAQQGGDKITEGNIKARLTLDPKVMLVNRKYHEAKSLDERAKLVLEAYRMRRDSIDVIGNLSGAERAMEKLLERNAATLRKTKANLQNKFGDETHD